MIVSLKKADILAAIQLAATIADKKPTQAILANVLLRTEPAGTLLVAATNLEITVMASVPASVYRDGDITTAAKSFADIVKALPGADIRFTRGENNYVEIAAGKSNFKVTGLAGKEFPNLPTAKGNWIAMKAAVLAEALRRVFFSISTDQTRAHLAGAYVESGATVSTDGHRLSHYSVALPFATSGNFLIPRDACNKIMAAVDGADDVHVAVTDKYIFVKNGAIVIAAKLLAYAFPPYEQVVPKDSSGLYSMNRAAVVEAVQRIRLMSSDATQGVRFTFDGTLLTIAADNPERGEAREEIDVEPIRNGGRVTIGMNAAYLLNWMEAATSDTVKIGLNGELDPIKLDADSYMGVIMPMRL